MGKKSGKYKKKEETAIEFRYFVEILIPLLLLGILFVNSQYLQGYNYVEAAYEYGNLIAGSAGYTAQDNSFQYTGDENSYVQLYGMEDIEQIIFTFAEKAKEDCSATLMYLDEEGQLLQTSSEGVWHKGEYTLTIDTVLGTYNSYLLILPTDFTLQRAYHAYGNGYEGIGRNSIHFGFIIINLILALILTCVERTRKYIKRAEEKTIAFFQDIKAAFSWKYAGVFAGIVAAGLLVSFLLAKAGGGNYSGKLAIAVFFLSMLLAVLFVNYRQLRKKIELIGFFAILFTGSMFSFTEPANVGVSWDDEVHFQNAIRLSHLFDRSISAADMTIINEYASVALEKVNYSQAEQTRYNRILDELERAHYYVEMEPYAVNNISIAYLPSAIGLTLGRGLGLPFHMVLSLGRWMNVLLLAVLCYFAMKRLKSGKIVVLLIALIPTNIFMAGNYTYDIWLLAWSIFGLSVFFGEWQRPDEKIGKWTPWLIGIAMFLAVLPKQVYFPLTCITLFMPKKKFESTKQAWFYRLVILAAICLPFFNVLVNNLSTRGEGTGDVRSSENVNSVEQLKYIRENPKQAAQMFYIYLKGYLNPLVYGREYMTNMAYLGYLSVHERIYMLLIVIGALISREEEDITFPWWSKLGVLFVYIVTGLIAAVSMYVYFTGVGAETVSGCQGRYLIPALFPLVYVVTRFSFPPRVKKVLREENINLVLIGMFAAGAFWGLWQGCLALY